MQKCDNSTKYSTVAIHCYNSGLHHINYLISILHYGLISKYNCYCYGRYNKLLILFWICLTRDEPFSHTNSTVYFY